MEAAHGYLPWIARKPEFSKAWWVCDLLAEMLEGAKWPEPDTHDTAGQGENANLAPPAITGLTLKAIRRRFPDLSKRQVDNLRKRLFERRRKLKSEFPTLSKDGQRPEYQYPIEWVNEFVVELRRKRRHA